MHWMITPQQTRSSAQQQGLTTEDLQMSGLAVLTFSKAIIDRMDELCGLREIAWIGSQHHPYAAVCHMWKGLYQNVDVYALVPPMGASPLACILEDLVLCGAQTVFLVCAAWSLGPPVSFGDLIIPVFASGLDGTSIHYGNAQGHIPSHEKVIETLSAVSRTNSASFHTGGVGSCEALYRITPKMVQDFLQRGCLCMDNGEAATLFSVTETLGILGGVLFQPYIDLQRGWDPARLRGDRYRTTCRLQAEIVLEAGVRLLNPSPRIGA
jgi:uridine phosphorylase